MVDSTMLSHLVQSTSLVEGRRVGWGEIQSILKRIWRQRSIALGRSGAYVLPKRIEARPDG